MNPDPATLSSDPASWWKRNPWGTLLLLAFSVLLLRVAYLVWICPYELAADEAHYWEWSRRPALSYYTKGPGVAWLIRACTGLFGTSEWAIRLPAALASCLSLLLLARFARSVAPDRPGMAIRTAFLFLLAPVFYGTAQFMTIDGPYYACWLLAAFTAWRLSQGKGPVGGYFLLGAVTGLGMLFKYTILLFLPGILLFLHRAHPLTPFRRLLRLTALLGGLLLCASPIAAWNIMNGWPTLAHLLGHAGLPGGDVQVSGGWKYNPLWTLGYLAYPFLFLGPPIAFLLLYAIRDAWQHRHEEPDYWKLASFALHSAIPIITFYLLLSLKTDIELNWVVAGYTVLLLPVAAFLCRRTSAAPVARLWKWTVGLGICTGLLISFGPWPLEHISRIEINGRHIPADRALKRVTGHRDLAATVDKLAGAIRHQTGQQPFVVAAGYSRTSLLAFYMRGHPSIRCASPLLGGRESAYDYFTDTNLSDPGLLGRPAILVGATQAAWDQSLFFEEIVRSGYPGRIFAAYGYGGPARESSLPVRP